MTIRSLGRLGAVMAFVAVAALPVPARAQLQNVERITSFDVTIDLRPDGTMHVVETIDYFFSSPRHGLLREIADTFPYDAEHVRRYPIANVSVTGSPGTPTETRLERAGDVQVIRVGDPDVTITGAHRYVLQYDVRGAVNRFEGHDELYWNVVGSGWRVPLEQVSVRVDARAAFTAQNCFAGPVGSSLRCRSAGISGSRATFGHGLLFPGQALTVVLALPERYVAEPGPILKEKQTLKRAFTATGPPLGVAVGLLAAGLAWLASRLRRGRDLRWAGQIPGLDPATGDDELVEPVGVFDDRAGPIEWLPPEQMRPAMMGLILDESADMVDITATVVDLAVRQYLTIEELPRSGLFRRRDWRLTRTPVPPADTLSAWEDRVLYGLFGTNDSVDVSDLKNEFHVHLDPIKERMYEEAQRFGWFSTRPDKVVGRWREGGMALIVAGGAATFWLAKSTRYGLTGVALLLLGIAVYATRKRMPFRTAKGSAALARALGFRRYLATAEAEQLRAEEKANVFARLLPYAIVLGETDHWAKVFHDLGLPKDESLSWYHGHGAWTIGDFTNSMNNFHAVAAQTMASTPGSSGSSGFSGGSSGGGGGGGGGGSW